MADNLTEPAMQCRFTLGGYSEDINRIQPTGFRAESINLFNDCLWRGMKGALPDGGGSSPYFAIYTVEIADFI